MNDGYRNGGGEELSNLGYTLMLITFYWKRRSGVCVKEKKGFICAQILNYTDEINLYL